MVAIQAGTSWEQWVTHVCWRNKRVERKERGASCCICCFSSSCCLVMSPFSFFFWIGLFFCLVLDMLLPPQSKMAFGMTLRGARSSQVFSEGFVLSRATDQYCSWAQVAVKSLHVLRTTDEPRTTSIHTPMMMPHVRCRLRCFGRDSKFSIFGRKTWLKFDTWSHHIESSQSCGIEFLHANSIIFGLPHWSKILSVSYFTKDIDYTPGQDSPWNHNQYLNQPLVLLVMDPLFADRLETALRVRQSMVLGETWLRRI